jgi:hypothetical protein
MWKFFQIALLGGAALVFVTMTSADLPEFPAAHFGADGTPNAFMTRRGYVAFMYFFVAVVPLLVSLLPVLVGRRWPNSLNIPNRDDWLGQERRPDTFATVESRTRLLAGAMIVFICYVHWLVVQANAAMPQRLDEAQFVVGLGIFALFIIGWIGSFYMRFRRQR